MIYRVVNTPLGRECFRFASTSLNKVNLLSSAYLLEVRKVAKILWQGVIQK